MPTKGSASSIISFTPDRIRSSLWHSERYWNVRRLDMRARMKQFHLFKRCSTVITHILSYPRKLPLFYGNDVKSESSEVPDFTDKSVLLVCNALP